MIAYGMDLRVGWGMERNGANTGDNDENIGDDKDKDNVMEAEALQGGTGDSGGLRWWKKQLRGM